MDKYLEKKIRKYVIATLTNPTMYLRKKPGEKEYFFVDDIEAATKTLYKHIADEVLYYYYKDTGLSDELVVIPVEITYEIIDVNE